MSDGASVSPEFTTSPQKEYSLPSDMRHDKQLGIDEQAVLQKQWNLFNELRGASQFVNPLAERKRAGIPALAKGTLIHGTEYSKDYIVKVKETGILSGEFVGIPEDSETNYCADFFKVPEDMSVEDYMKWCQEMPDNGRLKIKKPEFNYLPTPGKKSKGIAFIVNTTDQRLQPLLQHDAYNPNDQEVMKKMVNQLPAEIGSEKADRLSAVLVGVPSSFISGVIVGDEVTDEERQELRGVMGNNVICYNTSGEELGTDNNSPR